MRRDTGAVSYTHRRKGKTIIVIAQRLSTVKNADKIVVIDKGQGVEAGTHEELFNSNGMYHRLWKEQFDAVSYTHLVVRNMYRYRESVCLLLRNRWNNFVKYMDH